MAFDVPVVWFPGKLVSSIIYFDAAVARHHKILIESASWFRKKSGRIVKVI